jgi:hypothetical protein
MLFREVSVLVEYLYEICKYTTWQNAELLNTTAGGTHIRHWALNI